MAIKFESVDVTKKVEILPYSIGVTIPSKSAWPRLGPVAYDLPSDFEKVASGSYVPKKLEIIK
jgi:hypothetical protein